ncbi:hypothetical protein [Erythrobacter phage vB_EliS-L02]|nr:hypothetical protein [Erythrobacter phage vB_EliS-L02]
MPSGLPLIGALMNPIDIGPHPEAPDYYMKMGKPESWSEADCGVLCVRRMAATADMLVEPAARVHRQILPSGEEVYPVYVSEWMPTAEELELLKAGQPIRMMVSGTSLPPVAMWVKGSEET